MKHGWRALVAQDEENQVQLPRQIRPNQTFNDFFHQSEKAPIKERADTSKHFSEDFLAQHVIACSLKRDAGGMKNCRSKAGVLLRGPISPLKGAN